MTDRELLEKAAKAAGYPVVIEAFEDGIPFGRRITPAGMDFCIWNPLREDGDALRLMVKLKIEFYEGDDDGPTAYAGYFARDGRNTMRQKFACEPHGTDPCAATRRAIVRAAASLSTGASE